MTIRNDKGWAVVNEKGRIQYLYIDRCYDRSGAVAKYFAKREVRVGDTLHRVEMSARILK